MSAIPPAALRGDAQCANVSAAFLAYRGLRRPTRLVQFRDQVEFETQGAQTAYGLTAEHLLAAAELTREVRA